jgi:hypothetical protein
MKLLERLRRVFSAAAREDETEIPLDEDEDPFAEPVILEIRDVFDLHAIPPRQVKAVVAEYLREAHARGFRAVRIIHGKGVGSQRAMVRAMLERTPFVISYADAPPEAGGWGATIAELSTLDQQPVSDKGTSLSLTL